MDWQQNKRRGAIGILIGFMLLLLFACASKPTLSPLSQEATILAFGDSLTAGVGAPKDKSYPAVLATLTHRTVINAGTPGLVTAQALTLLQNLLNKTKPQLVILCLGGNDMLKYRKTATAASNLDRMVQMIQLRGIDVVLIAVPKPSLRLKPPAFYKKIAKKYHIPVDTKTLPKLEGNARYKSDSIHLNEEGYNHLAHAVAALLREYGAL